MHKKPFIALAVCLLLFNFLSCAQEKDKEESLDPDIFRINLTAEVISKAEPPKFSSIFSKIDYVRLETKEDCLVKGNAKVYVSSEYIYTVAFRQILQFDKLTGRFIKEIGHFGDDPEGYLATQPHVPPIRENAFVVLKAKTVAQIDAENNSLTNIANRVQIGQGFAALDSSSFVSFIPNHDCQQENRLLIYRKDGTEIKRFPNHLSCQLNDKNRISLDLSEGRFYHYDNNVLFKEVYNDTIFQVGKERLEKHAFFHLGDEGIPYSEKEKMNERTKWDKVIVYDVFESVDYIFFSYVYKNTTFQGVFDKHKRISFIPEKKAETNGIQDDIHGFLDFTPLTISKTRETVGYFYPQDILKWFEEREESQKVPEPLSSLKELKYDDNPVIAIAKLKERVK
ncbi:MAG: 6-bladed beta-propeller [Cytophagia bacterium]|nr:6-bladed beta-propeller [Cytophagia bacterium]